jgi:putative membrane protein
MVSGKSGNASRSRASVSSGSRWIAESINQLLPAFQLGGNLVRAQVIARCGVPGPLAGASVVVDITLHLVAQMLFTMLGLVLLLLHVGGRQLAGPVVVGLLTTAALVVAFYVVQRRGVFAALARRLASVVRSSDWASLSSHAEAMDDWIRRLYAERRDLGVSAVWHFLSWLLGAGEIWLALQLLDHPVPPATAVVIESLGEALRTAAFAIPGALGVQEGGFVLLGNVFGFGPELSIALSLTKRVRELCLGIPGLVAWQIETAAGAVSPRATVEP